MVGDPLICQFDSTEGLYHGWLSHWRRRLWDRTGFRMSEDLIQLEDVRRALARFHDLKDRLPVGQRDIGQYRMVEDLRLIIQPGLQKRTGAGNAKASKQRPIANPIFSTATVSGWWCA